MKQLIEAVQLLQEKEIELRSLNKSLDTTPTTGKLLFHIVAALAQFEQNNIFKTVNEICDLLKISWATFYNYMGEQAG